MRELAKKVVRRHLSKTVEVQCVSCGSVEECAVTVDGVALPEGWRPAMRDQEMLCSDICEWRWYH